MAINQPEVLAEARRLARFKIKQYLLGDPDKIIMIVTPDGKIIETNDTFLNRMGYTMEEVRYRALLDFVADEDYQRTLDELNSYKRFKSHYVFENWYRKKNGGRIKFRWYQGQQGNNIIYAEADIIDEQND